MNIDKSTQLSSDCLEQIFAHFKHDKASLYTLARVCRHWCRLIVTSLWAHPFKTVAKDGSVSIIRAYVACLPTNERQRLADEGINVEKSTTSLFNYPKYLRNFESHLIRLAIEKWLQSLGNTRRLKEKTRITYQYITNLIFSSCSYLRGLTYDWKEEFNTIQLLDITKFAGFHQAIRNLRTFKLDYHCFPTKATHNLLDIISQNTQNIHSLLISTNWYVRPEIILRFLKSQHNIKVLTVDVNLEHNPELLYMAIRHHAHSLTHLKLEGMNEFEQLLKLLVACKHLETLEILEFDPELIPDLEKHPIPQINIKNLYCSPITSDGKVGITSQVQIKSIAYLLEMSNLNLRTFTYLACGPPELMKVIKNRCPHITHLSLTIQNEDFNELCILLSNLGKLENFVLSVLPDFGSIPTYIIQKLAISIPPTLHTLGLNLLFTVESLKILLNECNGTIRALTMYQHSIENTHLEVISKYSEDNNGCLKEFRCLSHSIGNQEIAKSTIPIVGDVKPPYDPFYDRPIFL
ncbi:14000_t:CDS:1 [Acaulospora morrowiae]|uniref:14000_t:CDS:1 n=1 Tax=Acaulospora morrowiae TaxID=94023 RepID=A0A9N8WCN4_9GLOM|nr:14000_t:CDS:1 [Acaulospora morrowiae]